jgi:hypothetical protein
VSSSLGEPLDLPLDKWAEIAFREDWIGRWQHTAMFPSELVFYLAFCEHSGIKRIFESGRYEGYSTERLAAYAEREGAEVYSIDFEAFPDVAQRGRERLSKYPSVHLTKGNTYHVLGNIMQSHAGVPAALVVDGPKLFGAISVLFAAAAFPWIRVIAMHNLDATDHPDTASFFTRVAGRPRYYEDYATNPEDAFARLRAAEIERLAPDAQRPLERSSLAVMRLDDAVRDKLLWTMDRRFGRHQPLILYWRWRLQYLLSGRAS